MAESDEQSLSLDHKNWQMLLERLRAKVSAQQYQTWFAPLAATSCSEKMLRLVVPNRFYAEWLTDHYHEMLTDAFEEVTGSRPELSIEVLPASVEELEQAIAPVISDSEAGAAGESLAPAKNHDIMLNSRMIFENFVVGPNNRLAHAAAVVVAESPGGAYNPLFIHGASGLGKTHLLQAVCQATRARHPEMAVRFLSCEAFVSEFITALEKNELETFRKRYRDADMLVLDDVQFLAGKERSQEEFFHTFNALHGRKKQLVLASVRPPMDLENVSERLVSRFKWGLVARLEAPGFETRIEIVRHKAAEKGLAVPDEVAEFMAEHVDSSVRALEGAMIRLAGFASLSSRKMDLALAKEVLSEPSGEKRRTTVEAVQHAVAKAYRVTLTELTGKSRARSVVYPRQLAMFIARRLTGKSLEEIGKAFGGRDHSTVQHAVAKMETEMKESPETKEMAEGIERQLGQGV